jgi:hypothetical protein
MSVSVWVRNFVPNWCRFGAVQPDIERLGRDRGAWVTIFEVRVTAGCRTHSAAFRSDDRAMQSGARAFPT